MAAPFLSDITEEYWTGTGTGSDIPLSGSASPGNITFASAGCPDGATVDYVIDDGDGNREVQQNQTYTAATNTLTRGTPTRSTNAGAQVNFVSGNKAVSIRMLASMVGTGGTSSPSGGGMYTLGEDATSNSVVYLSGGSIYRVQPGTTPAGSVLGITATTGHTGDSVWVQEAPAEITGFSGLTAGVQYFADANGLLTATPPGSGLLQSVGIAVSATVLAFNLGVPISR